MPEEVKRKVRELEEEERKRELEEKKLKAERIRLGLRLMKEIISKLNVSIIRASSDDFSAEISVKVGRKRKYLPKEEFMKIIKQLKELGFRFNPREKTWEWEYYGDEKEYKKLSSLKRNIQKTKERNSRIPQTN